MRRSLRFLVAFFCIALAFTTSTDLTARHGAVAAQGNRERFVGAWRLARLEEPGADGKLRRPDCTGQFVFTRDGYASVQVMYRNPGGGDAGPVHKSERSRFMATTSPRPRLEASTPSGRQAGNSSESQRP